jgi:hypothetical protein
MITPHLTPPELIFWGLVLVCFATFAITLRRS